MPPVPEFATGAKGVTDLRPVAIESARRTQPADPGSDCGFRSAGRRFGHGAAARSFGTLRRSWRQSPPRLCCWNRGEAGLSHRAGVTRIALGDGTGPCHSHPVADSLLGRNVRIIAPQQLLLGKHTLMRCPRRRLQNVLWVRANLCGAVQHSWHASVWRRSWLRILERFI